MFFLSKPKWRLFHGHVGGKMPPRLSSGLYGSSSCERTRTWSSEQPLRDERSEAELRPGADPLTQSTVRRSSGRAAGPGAATEE